jgi:hypothetical protein
MTTKCPKGHTDLKRSNILIPCQTVVHCPECSSYHVEGSGEFWPVGTLDDPGVRKWLCHFADQVQEQRNRWAEFNDAPPNDPRIQTMEW